MNMLRSHEISGSNPSRHKKLGDSFSPVLASVLALVNRVIWYLIPWNQWRWAKAAQTEKDCFWSSELLWNLNGIFVSPLFTISTLASTLKFKQIKRVLQNTNKKLVECGVWVSQKQIHYSSTNSFTKLFHSKLKEKKSTVIEDPKSIKISMSMQKSETQG